MASTWSIQQPKALHHDSLVVVVGVLRSPLADALRHTGASLEQVLHAQLPEAITSARMNQVAVAAVKDAIHAAVMAQRPKRITMFYLGPVALAVALGHRWNALPPIQLHEFDRDANAYVETLMID
jgi:hypothetical protein